MFYGDSYHMRIKEIIRTKKYFSKWVNWSKYNIFAIEKYHFQDTIIKWRSLEEIHVFATWRHINKQIETH